MTIHYTAIDFLLLALAAIAMPVISILAGRTYARTPRSELNLIPRYWLIILRGVGVSLVILLAWHWTVRSYRTLGLDISVSRAGRVGFILDLALGLYYFYALLLRRRSAEQLAAARSRLDSYRILPQSRKETRSFSFRRDRRQRLRRVVVSGFPDLVFRASDRGLGGSPDFGRVIWNRARLPGMVRDRAHHADRFRFRGGLHPDRKSVVADHCPHHDQHFRRSLRATPAPGVKGINDRKRRRVRLSIAEEPFRTV